MNSINEIFSFVGLTAVLVSASVFIIRTVLIHYLERETLKQEVKISANASFDERIRAEVLVWANPILGSILDLKNRIGNILFNDGHMALDKSCEQQVNPDWSITYQYFMPSTLYLFAQYFCWIELFKSQMSFELFRSHQEKDQLIKMIAEVGRCLSSFSPGRETDSTDRQIFKLQQRRIGELLIVKDSDGRTCMTYSEFINRMNEEDLNDALQPLVAVLQDLQPGSNPRAQRLTDMHVALINFEHFCKEILKLPK